MSKLPQDGELVCVMPTEEFLHPHTVGLYLGDGKVVLASYIDGWTISNIEELPNYSAFGKSNVKEIYHNDSVITGYDYLAYDGGSPTVLNVRKVNNSWNIENDFKKPSWSQEPVSLSEPVQIQDETSEDDEWDFDLEIDFD